MANNVEEMVKNASTKFSSDIRKSIYDWICAIIIIAVIAASLDVIGLVDFSEGNFWEQITNFVIQWVPYFMATILLNNTLYKKGSFVGKQTKIYKDIANSYSTLVNSLSGKQLKDMYPFCDEYNANSLKSIQLNILKREGIDYDDFENKHFVNDKEIPALKVCTEEQLIEYGYNEAQIKAIFTAKNTHIKGLSVNLLLSNMDVKDQTDLGKNEKELIKRHNRQSILTYIFSTALMSLLAIKDISEWGWSGLILVLFKVLYTFARSYMSYFQGYNDITIDLTNHIARKTDIIKMYLNYIPEEVIEDNVENKVEISVENSSNISM